MSRVFQKFERKEDYRKQQARYFVAYEGEKTEDIYFKDLVKSDLFNDSGKIKYIPLNSKEIGNHPVKIIEYLTKFKRENKFSPKKNDEFWAIFDRDDWETKHSISFSELSEKSKSEENLFLAISNPCFEIWFVLHFKSIINLPDDIKHKLFENTKINNNKNYIDQYLGELITERRFDGRTRGYNKAIPFSLIKDSTYDAMKRAKELETADEDYPKSLGTHVYKLIEKLIISQDEYSAF